MLANRTVPSTRVVFGSIKAIELKIWDLEWMGKIGRRGKPELEKWMIYKAGAERAMGRQNG